MSNTLYIGVGNFKRLNHPDDVTILVLASDSYATDVLTFDDIDHLLACYPTQEDLIYGVLKLPAFDGAAIVHDDGTYELDSVGSVEVHGFPE